MDQASSRRGLLAAHAHARALQPELTSWLASNIAGKRYAEAPPKKKNRALRAPWAEERLRLAAAAAACGRRRALSCACLVRWGRGTLSERSPQRCFIAPRLVSVSVSGVSSVGACVRARSRPWRAAHAHGLATLSLTQKAA